MGDWMGIGALSRRTGVQVETIRYYERIGVLPAPPRSAGGHRQYREQDLRRLAFIRRARELGFSLDEVRSLLSLADGADSCRQARAVAQSHLEATEARLADLQRLAASLRELTRRCDEQGEPGRCPLIDDLFAAGGAE